MDLINENLRMRILEKIEKNASEEFKLVRKEIIDKYKKQLKIIRTIKNCLKKSKKKKEKKEFRKDLEVPC